LQAICSGLEGAAWALQGDSGDMTWGASHAGKGEVCSGDADFSSDT